MQLADRTPPPTARAAVKTRRAEADKVALYSGGVQGGGYSFETTRGSEEEEEGVDTPLW